MTTFDTSKLSVGLIGVKVEPHAGRQKITIGKYQYEVHTDELLYYPLQENGEYTVCLIQQESGNVYKYADSITVNVDMPDPLAVWRQSHCYIYWTPDMIPIRAAAGKTIPEIWRMIRGFKYEKTGREFIITPDITRIYADKDGNCFDITALFCSMLRSNDIPCKMIFGYHAGEFHAWAEMWNGKERIRYDVSKSAARRQRVLRPARGEYKAEYEY